MTRASDFLAVIRDDSRYAGQDDGRPFAVTLRHDPGGYIWEGNGNFYRPADLWLLSPSADPLAPPARIAVTDADAEHDEEAWEIAYQARLSAGEWFAPLPHQGDVPFAYIHRFGRRFTLTEAVALARQAADDHR